MTTKARPKSVELTPIGSGGLTVMSSQANVVHEVEDGSDWHVRLVELEPGQFHAICHLHLWGANSRTQTVVAAKLHGGEHLAAEGEEQAATLARTFPASYLHHALYDTAASAARVSLSLIASELKVSRVTLEPRLEIANHAEASKALEADS